MRFPSHGLPVIEPISSNPNPVAGKILVRFASLSKPAARPMGFLNFIPSISCFRCLFEYPKKNLVIPLVIKFDPRKLPALVIMSWIFSGSIWKNRGFPIVL